MKITTIITAVFIGFYAGCTPMTVHMDYDPDVDFSSYTTFNWMPELKRGKKDEKPTLTGPFLEKRIKKAVLENLVARGYEKKTGTADILIAYHINYKKKARVNMQGYGYWGPRPVDVYRYKEGTLILDFVDTETNQLVWRGWSISAVDPGSGPRAEQANINRAVEEILKRFPPY